jgi:HEPN domain-containing protein
MGDPQAELVRQWLKKAEHDLGSAKRLAGDPEPYFDTAIYHCQQAAEKALKAFLVYHEVVFEKMHNLVALVVLCTEIEPGFQILLDAAATLTPYATAFRYPGEFFESEPELSQVEEALQLAKQIVEVVMNHLPDEVHP